jgi:hypothetical protein
MQIEHENVSSIISQMEIVLTIDLEIFNGILCKLT